METHTNFFQSHHYYSSSASPEKRLPAAEGKSGGGGAGGENFVVEDLLDFPNDDGGILADDSFEAVGGGSALGDNSCNSSFSGSTHDGAQFAPADIGCRNLNAADGSPFNVEFFVPYEETAELEWLSNFVEESFSTEDLQRMQLISGLKARNDGSSDPTRFHPEPNQEPAATPPFRPETGVPGKARSKRSRAAPGNWTSRLLVVSSSTTADGGATTPAISSSSESDIASSTGKKTGKAAAPKKKEAVGPNTATMTNNSEGRRCLHCATDKTPQWRTGPMGPKTLCNACGVRYKSGRLVPEYRPAASPTFMLTKHSNSHRKVLEIRRQKELVRAQQQQQFIHQKMMFDVSNGEDYLIHQHIGPHFRQLI